MKIPWAVPYIGEEEINEVLGTLRSGWVTMGPRVVKFEKEVVDYFGMKHGIAVNSGIAAFI